MSTTESRILITSQIARTLRPVLGKLTEGGLLSEGQVREACHELAEQKVDARRSAVFTAPSGARVAMNGLAGMPEGRIFWASEIPTQERMRLQGTKAVNSTFDTATKGAVRANSILVTDSNRDVILENLDATRDADVDEWESRLLAACGMAAQR